MSKCVGYLSSTKVVQHRMELEMTDSQHIYWAPYRTEPRIWWIQKQNIGLMLDRDVLQYAQTERSHEKFLSRKTRKNSEFASTTGGWKQWKLGGSTKYWAWTNESIKPVRLRDFRPKADSAYWQVKIMKKFAQNSPFYFIDVPLARIQAIATNESTGDISMGIDRLTSESQVEVCLCTFWRHRCLENTRKHINFF